MLARSGWSGSYDYGAGNAMRIIITVFVAAVCVASVANSQSSSWVRVPNAFGGLDLVDVDFADQDTGYIAAPPFVLRTFNGGRLWEKIEQNVIVTSDVRAVSFITGSIGYAAGGAVLKTMDAGNTWRTILHLHVGDEGNNQLVRAMQFQDVGIGMIVGHNSLVRVTRDSGVNWTSVSTTTPHLTSIRIVDTGEAYVGGWGSSAIGMYSELLALKRNISERLVLVPQPIRGGGGFTVFTIEVKSKCCKWIGGRRIVRPDSTTRYSKNLFFTLDSNETWHQPTTELSSDINAIAFADTLHGFIGDEAGDIYRTSDGGFTWALEYKGNPEQPIKDIAIKGNTIIAVGDYSLILRRTIPVSVSGDEPLEPPALRLYPNPTTGVVTVESSAGPAELYVVDVLGTIILQTTVDARSTLDLSAQPPAMYRVLMRTSQGVVAQTVAVVR